jgi:hypothetical protein
VDAGLQRRVTDPDRTEWTVGRVWFGGRRLKSWESRLHVGSGITGNGSGETILSGLFDGADIEDALVLLAAGLALIFIVIPLLLFGVELLVLGAVLAAGVVARSLFGKPRTVTATSAGDEAPTAAWRVKGWPRSAQLIDQVCTDIELRGELVPEFPGAEFVGPGAQTAGATEVLS